MTLPAEAEAGLLTIDELAASVGMTVRNTRYYAGLGLIPPPTRRGRVAYYSEVHRARLDMVRRLQDHGFTLQAVERYVADLPADTSPEDLTLRRAMLTSWTPTPTERLTRAELVERAGRPLSADDIDLLVTLRSLERDGRRYVPTSTFAVGLELMELDIPREAMGAAGDAIDHHMQALAEELTDIMQRGVLGPFREAARSHEEAERLEETVSRLRRLTLEALVAGFQRAADAVIRRSLAR
jgi:DNA-binding transcriptional MerR regulator